MKRHLVVIDPQRDFCKPKDNPDDNTKGALYVNGADEDMKRLATMLTKGKDIFDKLYVTLDSHQWVHIAHPIFWVDAHGAMPEPLVTVITEDDIVNGKWKTRHPGLMQYAREYVKALKQQGRYELRIWPAHCIIGTQGHAIHDEFDLAVKDWAETFATVDYVTKGSNIKTEHYSAVQADVPDPSDPGTQINTRFIEGLMEADELVFAGEALDFCLLNTMRDIVTAFNDPSLIRKFVALTDASSSISGCNFSDNQFFQEMVAKGMRLTTTMEYLK